MIPDRAKAVRELLAFYLEAGVDAVVAEEPANRFADAHSPSGSGEPSRPSGAFGATRQEENEHPASIVPAPPSFPPAGLAPSVARRGASPLAAASAAPPSAEAALTAARASAKGAASLEELRAILERFEGCALRSTATQLVFGDGNPHARLMLVGEAPGRDEDLEGLPFVGRSGKLLDRMLAAIGLDRKSSYIANIVSWRPPGNRKPTPQEAAVCLPFLRRQIELVDPDVLVCLGDSAAQTLLDTKDGITKSRGRWFAYETGTRQIRALATFHPAYLLRTPLSKRLAWRDFLAIRKALAGTSPDAG
jgi:DNA polymerase